jgi:hypothetical protein
MRAPFALSALFALMAIAPDAGAQQVVVGQTAPTPASVVTCENEFSYDEVQVGIATGTSYVVPVSGAITTWSTFADAAAGQALELKVFRPVGSLSFLVVGFDVRFPVAGVLNTFELAMPVQAGDIVGVNNTGGFHSPCQFETGLAADLTRYAKGHALPGRTVSFKPEDVESGFRPNISATVLPAPVISSISPAKGSIKGAKVVVSGANFANIKTVKFGEEFARNYTVESETQITATAPTSTKRNKLPVVVTTAAGVATSAQAFAYEGCKVPNLVGRKLKPGKRTARKSDCRIGEVRRLDGVSAKTGRVVRQSPPPGKLLAPRYKIKVTLGD